MVQRLTCPPAVRTFACAWNALPAQPQPAVPEHPPQAPPPVCDDSAAFTFAAPRLRQVVVLSPGGAQGGAFAAQALRNAKAGDFEVILRPRDEEVFRQASRVRCGDETLDLARHPHATVAAADLPRTDAATTLVIDPTVVRGLADTIARTPVGSMVAYTQNGIPVHQDAKRARALEEHTLVSMVTSIRRPGQGVTVRPGGTLLADENDPLIDALHTVLRDRGFFRLVNVPDIEAARYEKLAFNCALNIAATLFGQTLGALLDRMRSDPRCERLIGGLAAEVCAVATARGVRIKPADGVIADIHAGMARFADHPTSMRAAFDAGEPTEIGVLNAGVARLGRAAGIATPLNDLVTAKLAMFEALRDGVAASEPFHRRHAQVVADTIEEILEAAARA